MFGVRVTTPKESVARHGRQDHPTRAGRSRCPYWIRSITPVLGFVVSIAKLAVRGGFEVASTLRTWEAVAAASKPSVEPSPAVAAPGVEAVAATTPAHLENRLGLTQLLFAGGSLPLRGLGI